MWETLLCVGALSSSVFHSLLIPNLYKSLHTFFRNSLLLLVGVFSVVFCGLFGRGSLGRVCHWVTGAHGCRKWGVCGTGWAPYELLAGLWLAKGLKQPASSLSTQFGKLSGMWPVIAPWFSVAAASLIPRDTCSLYRDICGMQMRLGASLNGPWVKLLTHMESCPWYSALFEGLS